MANAALVHIPPYPFLTNRCEILDMAWFWPPGEKGLRRWGDFYLPQHPCCIFCFFHFHPLHIFTLLLFVHQEKKCSSVRVGDMQYLGASQLYYRL